MNNGITYFPLDCQLDDKFALIEAEFGLTGFAVVVKLFQRIYGQQGYYCEFTDEVALLFGREVGLGGNVVLEIVTAAIKRGIFDRELYEKYHILTSRGIQERYFEAVSRRKKLKIEKQYLFCSVYPKIKNACNFGENVCNFEKNADIFSTKESKEKKRKGNIYIVGEDEKTSENDEKLIEVEKPKKHKYGEFKHVLLTDEEYSRLLTDYGEQNVNAFIQRLDEYLENRKDKHYANHSLTIRNWLKKQGVLKLSENTDDYWFDADKPF